MLRSNKNHTNRKKKERNWMLHSEYRARLNQPIGMYGVEVVHKTMDLKELTTLAHILFFFVN